MFHPTLFRRMVFLLLLPVVIFSQNLKLLTPNGGIFNGGEKITISWEASSSIKAIILYFSLDKNVWYEIGSVGNTGSGGTYEWTAPYFKTEKKEVWVKIEAPEKKMADTTEISFTIRAAEPDAAEPNNSISTATVLEIGDTLSGVITMGYGGKPEGLYNIDTQIVYSDTDFFAIKVEAGNILFIRTLPDFDSKNRLYYTGYLGSRVPAIFLMDSTGNTLTHNSPESDSISFAISKGGTYYCGVLSGGIFSPFAAWYHKYKITSSIRNFSLVKLEPITGTFSGGDKVKIRWSGGDTTMTFTLYFSFDKKEWHVIGGGGGKNNGSYDWVIPYFKNEKKEVWLQIEEPVYKIVDSTETSFTIKAAEPDAAEPNNSISTATLLKIGDTLSGLITMGYGGKPEGLYNIDTQTVYSDTDFFAIKVSSPTLLFISVLPDFGKRSYYEGYLGSRVPAIFLMDQRGNIIATNSREMDSILVAVEDSGSYYCGVLSGGIFSSFAAWYHKYKITVRGVAELKKLSVSQSAYLPYNDNYKFTVVDSNALLSLSVIAKEKKDGNITVARLPADSEVINFPPQKEPLSIVMIEASPVVDSVMDSVSIEVGYNKNMVSDTGTISVMWYNDSTGVWENVAFEKDLQNNKVIIGSKHLSIYGVFQRNSVSVTKERTKGGGELSFKVKSVSKQTIYIERGKEIVEKNIKVSLYSVNGKKILTSLIDGKIGREEKASLQLPYNLRKGVYILRIEGANTDKSISIPIVR